MGPRLVRDGEGDDGSSLLLPLSFHAIRTVIPD